MRLKTAAVAELYNTCFCCYKAIKEGDHVVVTDDVTCTEESTNNEPALFETWDYNPYRGVYCTDCWDHIVTYTRKVAKVRQNPYVSAEDAFNGCH